MTTAGCKFSELDAEVLEWLRRYYPCGRRVSAGTIAARIQRPRRDVLRSIRRLKAAGAVSSTSAHWRDTFAGLAGGAR